MWAVTATSARCHQGSRLHRFVSSHPLGDYPPVKLIQGTSIQWAPEGKSPCPWAWASVQNGQCLADRQRRLQADGRGVNNHVAGKGNASMASYLLLLIIRRDLSYMWTIHSTLQRFHHHQFVPMLVELLVTALVLILLLKQPQIWEFILHTCSRKLICPETLTLKEGNGLDIWR